MRDYRFNFIAHLNGTHPESLCEQSREVLRAAAALRKAMEDAAPNMRDYYLHRDGQGKFKEDRKQWREVLDHLDEVEAWATQRYLATVKQEEEQAYG